jgi:nucleoside-diphosphate-sugar epimerase
VFDTITVIGSGRVGSAVAARLRERGFALRDDGELVLLCVPDTRSRRWLVGRRGPWVAHVSRRDLARGARSARATLRRSIRCRRSRDDEARSSSTARSRR